MIRPVVLDIRYFNPIDIFLGSNWSGIFRFIQSTSESAFMSLPASIYPRGRRNLDSWRSLSAVFRWLQLHACF